MVEKTAVHNSAMSQCMSKCEASEHKIHTLEKQCDILRMDGGGRNKDIAKYKGELARSLEQCAKLEQEKAQLLLEQQQQAEEVEIRICKQNESLINELTAARDRVSCLITKFRHTYIRGHR